MDTEALRARVEAFIRSRELIPPGGDVTALVSGGADSTCLWHTLRELGYRVSALHVNHGLRGAESDEDARFCRELMGAEVVDGRGGRTEDELRRIRYSFATDRLRATGHTASDQVETVLYRIVSSGAPGGIRWRRDDGVVRPLLRRRRVETEAYCRAEGLAACAGPHAGAVRPPLERVIVPPVAFGLANFAHDVLVQAQPALRAQGCDIAPLL